MNPTDHQQPNDTMLRVTITVWEGTNQREVSLWFNEDTIASMRHARSILQACFVDNLNELREGFGLSLV